MVRVRYELDVRCPVVLTRDGERVYQYDRGPRAADKSQELFNRNRVQGWIERSVGFLGEHFTLQGRTFTSVAPSSLIR